MKLLRLLRHAKSSWEEPALEDADRPLTPRGLEATRRLARWIDEHEVRPDLVVCSPAVRARETLEPLLSALGDPEVLADTLGDVLLVGHNPGLADLSLMLGRPSALRDRVAAKLPTGALVTLEMDARQWSEVTPGTADLIDLVLPRELG